MSLKRKTNNLKTNISHNDLINEISNLKDDVNKLKDEINSLHKEIKLLKSYHSNHTNINNDINDYEQKNNNKNIININEEIKKKKNNDPTKIELLYDLTKDSYSDYYFDNSFYVYKSINEINYLIYATKNKSLINYNLNKEKKEIEIKNAHDKYITNFRYYNDNNNKKEIIMSISSRNNNIKLWNICNWECLININNINSNGEIYSACFLNYQNNNYIVTSNYNESNSDPIKIFDFKGKKIKEINQSDDDTFYIDAFYDKIHYLITCNGNYVKSYDYNNNRLYHRYYEYYNNSNHLNSIVYNNNENNNEMIKLIETCEDGFIRVWNFHSGSIINRIDIGCKGLACICLWNINYIFVGDENKYIKLINLKSGKIIKCLTGHKKGGITIKKINHPKYGECIVSKGQYEDQIKIWINKV